MQLVPLACSLLLEESYQVDYLVNRSPLNSRTTPIPGQVPTYRPSSYRDVCPQRGRARPAGRAERHTLYRDKGTASPSHLSGAVNPGTLSLPPAGPRVAAQWQKLEWLLACASSTTQSSPTCPRYMHTYVVPRYARAAAWHESWDHYTPPVPKSSLQTSSTTTTTTNNNRSITLAIPLASAPRPPANCPEITRLSTSTSLNTSFWPSSCRSP